MPTKAELYAEMAGQGGNAAYGELAGMGRVSTTASRLYKYPFHEQLMIDAQRPDATACAENHLWNEQRAGDARRRALTRPEAYRTDQQPA